MNAEEKRERRVALCGTETYWPKPELRPYLVNLAGEPMPQEVLKAYWPDLETVE